MLLSSLAFVISLQGAGETAVAIRNDDPKTWSVEYPRLIEPFVVQYRNCLYSSDRRVTGEANFEAQHAGDIPRCATLAETAKLAANEAMRGAKTAIGPEEVDQLFRNIGLIHVARGRDLDDQFRQRMTAAQNTSSQYENERPRGLVLELRDASVVKARTDATAPATSKSRDRTNAQD